jgi:transposase InsO family protein
MKKPRFSGSKIFRILKEAELGVQVPELCRKYVMSSVSFYNWRSKYGGVQVSDMKLVAHLKRRKRPVDQGERQASAIAPNTLDRDFTATGPNQKWVADFAYVWTSEGWLDVATVIDLFSRRIVGWSMKARMTADLVTDALVMPIWRRRPDLKLLHQCLNAEIFASLTEARVVIEQWRRRYNDRRRHSAQNYCTPEMAYFGLREMRRP